jgi:hypothetical protein
MREKSCITETGLTYTPDRQADELFPISRRGIEAKQRFPLLVVEKQGRLPVAPFAHFPAGIRDMMRPRRRRKI